MVIIVSTAMLHRAVVDYTLLERSRKKKPNVKCLVMLKFLQAVLLYNAVFSDVLSASVTIIKEIISARQYRCQTAVVAVTLGFLFFFFVTADLL